MKTFIQRTSDNYFFAGKDSAGKEKWTQDRKDAFDFVSSVAALDETFSEETCILLCFDGGPAYDLRLPTRYASLQSHPH